MLSKKFVTENKELDKARCKLEIKILKKECTRLIKELHSRKNASIIVVLQGLDASGKDGIVERCFSQPGPRFYKTASFKKPTPEELSHDFLWRIHKECPPKGVIGVFNRSHYEDILVPQSYGWIDEKELENRYESINDFENHLKRSGTYILKFFLNISYDLQGEKLEERRYNPLKRYKHNDSDWETRAKWDDFMKSYDGIFENCEKAFEWINVPADKKWQKDYVVRKEFHKTLNRILKDE